mmetsp:Transcript_5098/g.12817  ORF Transcript_5098/g.12817 Transcript_5098/m.12817 type:complete len:204 (+) Transcript_5098:382-993(+)
MVVACVLLIVLQGGDGGCQHYTALTLADLMAGEDVARQDRHAHFFVNHEAEDAHLRGPAVIKLDRPLPQLRGIVELVPAEVQLAVPEVAHEFRLVVQPVGVPVHDLGHREEEEHLDQDLLPGVGRTQRRPRSEARGDVRGKIREAISGCGREVSDDGEHGDAAVLELDEAETIESILIGVLEHAEGIEQAEGGLGAEFGFEGV